MTYWKNEGLEDLALSGSECESSRPVVTCRFNSLFILLKYFQKYLYTFKTTTFLLLLKHFFGQYFVPEL